MLTSIRIIGAAVACTVALATPAASALAQTASQTGYDETGVLSATGVRPGAPAPAPIVSPTSDVLGERIAGVPPTPSSGILGERVSREPPTPTSGVRGQRGSGTPGSAGSHPAALAGGPSGELKTSSSGSRTGSSTLPFTGLDAIVVALLGLLLLGVGAATRTAARAR